MVHLRAARREDLPAINEIYNHYVLGSTCTYQTVPSTLEERSAWFDRHGGPHPVTVAVSETDGSVVGWGSLSPFHAREAFARTVEDSVYLDPTWQGRGVGGLLLADLLERASALGHHVVIAAIDAGQAASVALHARYGFAECGRFPEVGFKFGRWLDVIYLQKRLNPDR
jgi:phosphinothricin acetyltransferase